MSVDLDENNKREILSLDDFYDIIEEIRIPYNQCLADYVILEIIRKGNINLDELFKVFNVESLEDLRIQRIESLGYDVDGFKNEYLLENIPRELIDKFGDLDKISDNIKNIKDLLILLNKFYSKEYDKIYDDKLRECADRVSKYDLSEIPSDLYSSLSFLKYINFENTGANIDFDSIYDNRFSDDIYISSESLRGTNLISFDDSIYLKDNSSIRLDISNFDLSQYQRVIDSYNVEGKNIPIQLVSFLATDEIQENSKWLIDYAFEDLDRDIVLAENIWEKLSEKSQLNNSECFIKLMDYFKEYSIYSQISSILSNTSSRILEDNINVLREIFKNEKDFVNYVTPYLSDEYNIKFYEDSSENLSVESRAKVLAKTGDKYIDDNFDLLLLNYSDDRNSEISHILSQFSNHEFNDNSMRKILDFARNNFSYEEILKEIFCNLSNENKEGYFYEFIKLGNELGASYEEISNIIKYIDFNKNKIDSVKKDFPRIAYYMSGDRYLETFEESISKFEGEGREEFAYEHLNELISALKIKYNNSYEDRDYTEEYSKEVASLLWDLYYDGNLSKDNLDDVLNNIQVIGEKLFSRIYNSNSNMLRENFEDIKNLISFLPVEDSLSLIDEAEGIFAKDEIPDFVKLYKFYEKVIDKNGDNFLYSNFSPKIKNASSKSMVKKIIFSDLFNISLKSNNKSLKKFLDVLENGNDIYVKYLKGDSLSTEEEELLKKYSNTLYTMYSESGVASYDKKNKGEKIKNTKDYIKTLDDLSKRYIGDSFPNNLSNEVLNTIIGRYDELLSGKKTIEDFKSYMETVNKESNERHAELEKQGFHLESGDFIKGVKGFNCSLQSLFSNGIRAGAFLGVDSNMEEERYNLDSFVVQDSSYINKDFFQDNDYDLLFVMKGDNYAKKSFCFEKDKEKDILEGVNNRINGTFEEPKLETFSNNGNKFGIRTGMSITDIDYIYTYGYSKDIGYELAMNGTFIPIVDINTNEVLFGIDDYNKIREQMRGLSYFNADKFKVDKSAYNFKVKEKLIELFADSSESIFEKDARIKRDIIENKIRNAIKQKLELGFESKVTGDMTPRVY